MRLSLRLIVFLATALTVVTLVVTWRDIRAEQQLLQRNLLRQAHVVTERFQDAVEPLTKRKSGASDESVDPLPDLVERFAKREGLTGLAVHDASGSILAVTLAAAPIFADRPDLATRCKTAVSECGEFLRLGDLDVLAYSAPMRRNLFAAETVTTIHDAGALAASRSRLWHAALLQVVPQVLIVTLITVGVVRSTVLSPIAKTARWMKDLRFGRAAVSSDPAEAGLLDPISIEATSLAKSLASAQATAEGEARLREAGDSLWTPERLRVGIHNRLNGNRLFVVSNREPYEHMRRGRSIDVVIPASGLVTALEPILRACDGTWIAHGSGDADREVVDAHCRVRVPPEQPRYTLRRVWLTRKEQEGYYYGFANEGLWPLCHIAYTRPMFRAGDWEAYQRVNQKFADAVVDEMAGVEEPLLLIQDYHFACLPALVKEKRPDARVAVFWHIPWPNPEAFGICPWRQELLAGLLGADIVSFHIEAHCRNFLDTVDRFLECRIEWERHAVHRSHHVTCVHPHPISVALSESTAGPRDATSAPDWDREAIRRELGVAGLYLGVGVDRVDYTKGIIERFRGIERFLERHPAYLERFAFIQIGAPSRTHIKRYQDLLVEVETEADRINMRFATDNWQPIRLHRKHHSHEDINRLYRIADFCLVTSLHDGMNLVAKEFAAARTDEDGVLVLSQFAGASGELTDALLINPYDIDQLAESIAQAIEMPAAERRTRMRQMRRVIRDHNVYRWAAELVSDLAKVRPIARAS
jgi:trehalose 6-phosphate synthase